MKNFSKFILIFLGVFVLFFPETIEAKENKLRVICNPLAISVKDKKNFSTFPGADNQQIYEIIYDSKNKVSEVKIIDKFDTGVIYQQDQKYIIGLFDNSIEDTLYKEKIFPQKFTQIGNKLIIRPSIPVVFNKKRMMLNDGTHTLDLTTLDLKKTLMYNDDWVKKANCKKVGNEEPSTYAYNLAVISQRAAGLREELSKDEWTDIFKKYISLLDISINAFDEWEEKVYPNEVPFYRSRLIALGLMAFEKSNMYMDDRGIKNPYFNIDEAYEYANKGVNMLDSPKLQKTYAGFFLQRANYGFAKHMLSKNKNISVLHQNINDVERYLVNPDNDLGKAYYLKGASQLFINTKSSVKEACKNLTRAMELNYKFLESFKKTACKES